MTSFVNDPVLIETLDRRSICEADARLIAEMIVAIWPKPGRTVETQTADLVAQWKNYDGPEAEYPRSFFIREGSSGIAHASAYPRTIRTRHGDKTVLALARVCTAPAARGRKLGDAVVRAAFNLVDRGTYPFASFKQPPPCARFMNGSERSRSTTGSSTRKLPTRKPTRSGPRCGCAILRPVIGQMTKSTCWVPGGDRHFGAERSADAEEFLSPVLPQIAAMRR